MPIIALQGRLSKSADAYAFGVLLWEMFTGQRPWAGMLQMQVRTLCLIPMSGACGGFWL